MNKEKINNAISYTLANPFEALIGASLWVVAMSAGISVFLYALSFGYYLIKSAFPL